MKTFILIILLTGGSQTGKTSVVAEFNSAENCRGAGKAPVEYVHSHKVGHSNYVTAWGCYEK